MFESLQNVVIFLLLEFDNGDASTYEMTVGLHNLTIVFIGHYNMPQYAEDKLMIVGHTSNHLRFITDESTAENTSGYNKEVVWDAKKVRVVKFVYVSEKIGWCADQFY